MKKNGFWQLLLYVTLVIFYYLLYRFAMRVRFILYSFIMYKVLCTLTSTSLTIFATHMQLLLEPYVTTVLCTLCVVSTLYLVDYLFLFPLHLDNSSFQNSAQVLQFYSCFLFLSGLDTLPIVSIVL